MSGKDLGWLLPDTLTGHDLLCVTLKIPNNLEYRAAFMGALHMLEVWFNWEKTGDTRAAQAAAYWRDLLGTYLFVGEDCDMPLDVRQNEETPCILEKTYNDGETWVQWANLRLCAPVLVNLGNGVIGVQLPDGTVIPTTSTPDDTYDGREHAPPPAPRGGTETDNKCLAAANAVNVLVSLHATVMRQINVPDELSIAAAIAGLLISLLFLPVAIGLIIIAIGGLLTIAASLTYGDFDSGVQHDLRCILDCAATDAAGVVTFDFTSVKSQVDALSAGLDIWAAISKYLDIIGESGLNLAGATTAITDADCTDCGCGEWCLTVDFTANDGGFTPYGSGQGAWTSGTGWQATNINLGGADRTLVQIVLSLGASVDLTSIGLLYDWTGGSQTSTIQAKYLFTDNFAHQYGVDMVTGNETNAELIWEEAQTRTEIDLLLQCSINGFGGSATAKSMTIRGTGTPPTLTGWTEC